MTTGRINQVTIFPSGLKCTPSLPPLPPPPPHGPDPEVEHQEKKRKNRTENPKCRPPGSSEYKRFIVFPARGKIVQPHWVAARRTTHIPESPVLSNPFQVFKRQRSPRESHLPYGPSELSWNDTRPTQRLDTHCPERRRPAIKRLNPFPRALRVYPCVDTAHSATQATE